MANKPEEKIYLTYKTRMTTEARLRSTLYFSQILLAWYSFALIVFSLLDLSGSYLIDNFSMISAVASIAIFSISLFVYGERYAERAEQFRSCYLKLQALYESAESSDTKMERYSGILALYPNQSDADYDDMLFDACLRGQRLENAYGPVKISWPKFIEILIKRLGRIALLSLMILLPIWFGVMWVQPITASTT